MMGDLVSRVKKADNHASYASQHHNSGHYPAINAINKSSQTRQYPAPASLYRQTPSNTDQARYDSIQTNTTNHETIQQSRRPPQPNKAVDHHRSKQTPSP